MATFLTTAKMNPALVARVEKAVHGTRSNKNLTRRIISVARFLMVATVIVGVYSVVTARRKEAREVEKARAQLMSNVQTKADSLTSEDKKAVVRAETWLMKIASPTYSGDVIADEIRGGDKLKATLAEQQVVYVRGPLEAFGGGSPKIAETAAASGKDSLITCLVDPPSAKTEKVLIDSVRIAYMGGSQHELKTANVRRLHDAIFGLPYVGPAFTDRVKAATDRIELSKLSSEFDKISFERTKQAVKASVFVIAIDEPGDGKGPTELDGERPHAVRVAVIDLAQSKPLFLTRRNVDPSWVSQAKRPTYAGGLDSCALAFDIHESARKPR